MNEIIEIDGSKGSGGGQILRTSLGLSALTKNPIKIKNIRANRPKPGLAAQHLTSLKTIAQICNAEVEGAEPNSTEVIFKPKNLSDCGLNVNIGTAGSITLLLQTILLPALKTNLKLRVTGGTDVEWSPSAIYLQHVLFPTLKKIGCNFDSELIKRGYFPKGNGAIKFISKPAKLPLKPLTLTTSGKLNHIKLFSHSSSLPKEVSENQRNAAAKNLSQLNTDITSNIENNPESDTIGSGIDLIANFENSIIGANTLGKKGKPALQVGKDAAQKLLKEINSKAPVDQHLADQLIPFMAIANGKSEIHTSNLTSHTLTNISVTEQILGTKFLVIGEPNQPATITVEGISFK